jgi:hypothetical protein
MRLLSTLVAFVLMGLSLAACGGGKDNGSASQSTSSGVAKGGVSTALTKSYLNDGDNDTNRSGDSDSDGDNNKDTDQDPHSDYKSNDNGSYHDGDDENIIEIGHAVDATETGTIADLIKRYYKAIAADDATEACRMIYPVLAKAIPEDYGQAPGPAYARGKTCPVVLSKIVKHLPINTADLGTIDVTEVHVEGNSAHALLGSKVMPASFLILQRAGGVWKVDMLMARALP